MQLNGAHRLVDRARTGSSLAVLVAALALSACGGGGPALSRRPPARVNASALFAHDAARACARLDRAARTADARGRAGADGVALLGELADRTETARTRLSSLSPPASRTSGYLAFVSDLDDLAAALRREQSDLRGSDASAGGGDVRRLRAITARARRHAAGLPALRACTAAR